MNLEHHIEAQIELLTLVKEHGIENVEWRRSDWPPQKLRPVYQDRPAFLESDSAYIFRARRPTYSIHADGLPAPETKAPPHGKEYFNPDPTEEDYVVNWLWSDGSEISRIHLERGLVYLTEEDAATVGRAMVPCVIKSETESQLRTENETINY